MLKGLGVFLSAGSSDPQIQPGGKRLGLFKQQEGSMRSSNELFVVVNADGSRRQ